MNADFTDQASLRARLRFESIGPFYFAWADKNEPFDPAAHARIDEDVFKFDVDHAEGDFATLTAIVRNPRIGLLAPSRRVWAWLSWQNGAELVPLFYGRLVGVPTDINQELVTLVFTARPADFVALKAAKAETLKVRPYYDPIWINPDSLDDPDTVLEARSALWSIDRVTNEVDISDVLIGEDGIEEFGPRGSALQLGQDQSRRDAAAQRFGRRHHQLDATSIRHPGLRLERPDLHRAIADFGLAEARRDPRRRLDGRRRLGARPQRRRECRDSHLHASTGRTRRRSTQPATLCRSAFRARCRSCAALTLTTDLTRKFQTGVIDEGGPDSDPINIPATHGKHRALRAALAGQGVHDAEIRRQSAAQGTCALYAFDRCTGHRHAGRGRRYFW